MSDYLANDKKSEELIVIKKIHSLAKKSQYRRHNPPRACKKTPKSIPVGRLTFSITKDTNHSQRFGINRTTSRRQQRRETRQGETKK